MAKKGGNYNQIIGPKLKNPIKPILAVAGTGVLIVGLFIGSSLYAKNPAEDKTQISNTPAPPASSTKGEAPSQKDDFFSTTTTAKPTSKPTSKPPTVKPTKSNTTKAEETTTKDQTTITTTQATGLDINKPGDPLVDTTSTSASTSAFTSTTYIADFTTTDGTKESTTITFPTTAPTKPEDKELGVQQQPKPLDEEGQSPVGASEFINEEEQQQ
ncbi:MAG: hypothetical protein IJD48_02960 [Clostridia bacterium]|nr:hypothetical protein [Clostridia bacterium]